MNKYKEVERIIIDKECVDKMEEDIIIRRAIERYMYVRQFVYGRVLDIACGVGYGSYLLSKNPDVKKLTGIDKSEKAINNACRYFKTKNIEFAVGSPETVTEKFDVLVTLETIEHLPDPTVLKQLAQRCGVCEIIISFPRKKTTHYNPYHLYDYTKDDILSLFNHYECYRTYNLHDSTIMNLIKIERDGCTERKRYLW